ncbi:MAG: ASKHA domain-containing protein [Candidatus Heimdallarchaeota archaeon]
MSNKKVKVTIQPENLEVMIPQGESIFYALKEAGVIINIPCGGHGTCGQCKVIVLEGAVQRKGLFHEQHFSKEELAAGFHLACQTKVLGDAQVFLPDESRVVGQKILAKTAWSSPYSFTPVVQRLVLTLSKPDTGDNTADSERLYRELGKYFPEKTVQLPLPLLQALPTLLRKEDWTVTLVINHLGESLIIQDVRPGKETTNPLLGLALDLGTTTIVASLIDLLSGEVVNTASAFNKQMFCGEDVITRIHFASENKTQRFRLQQLVVETINHLIAGFGVEHGDIRALTVAGNTVMMHLFFGIDPSFLWREPYTPAVQHLPVIDASVLGLQLREGVKVAALPCVSSYVGGDVVGGIIAAGLHRLERPGFLVDIGTNGEIVLGCKNWLVSCSVPAGPALEGAGVKCGMRATTGAIEHLNLEGAALEPRFEVIGGGKPAGLCGSALVDLVAELFKAGILTKTGHLNSEHDRVSKGDHSYEFLLLKGEETSHGKDIVLTEADISSILKAKSAFFAAYKILLQTFDLTFQDIDSFFVSGGFGNYLDAENAILLGLYPDIPITKIKFLGNSSLAGAIAALRSRSCLKECQRIATSLTNIELSTNYSFMDEFTLASFIPHTNLTLFPSVQKQLQLGGNKN